MSLNIELARNNMIEQQVRPWDVLDARVLEALAAVRREDFVPDATKNLAFTDIELPLGHGEVMAKPVIEGRLLQAAAPTKTDTVLEIGTGSGFLTACLAYLGGNVTSVEQHADFVDAARARLTAAGVRNVHIDCADAVNEYKPDQQYDVVVVTGAVATLPQRWMEWVKPGGRLVAVVGESPAQTATSYTRASDGKASTQPLFETDLPYLAHAAPAARFTL
jgi:protein-L-isoaspartate(D-aspartate) O-methyltransferase